MRDVLRVVLAALSVFSMGGVVFGLAALYPVLYAEGVFVGLCGEAAEACLSHPAPLKCCDAQMLRNTLVSCVALFASDGMMVVFGEVADRAGPRAAFAAGAALAWAGFAFMALYSFVRLDGVWFAALACLGVAGPGVFLGCLVIGEAHPRLEPLVTSVAASMADSSSLVFVLLSALYFAAGLSFRALALGCLTLCLAAGLATLQLLPPWSTVQKLRAGRRAAAEARRRDVDQKKALRRTASGRDSSPRGENGGAMYGADATLLGLFCRSDTLLLLAFMSVYNLKSSWYITTISDQLRELAAAGAFDDATAVAIADTFNVAFPLGAGLCSIGASALLSWYGAREDVYMGVVLALANLHGLAAATPLVSTQYWAALSFGPTRTLQWACYFHLLCRPSRYPPAYYGRLLGYANLVIALLSDGPPYLLHKYVASASWPSTPSGRYLAVNVALQLLLLACVALPVQLALSRSPRRRGTLSRAATPLYGPLASVITEESAPDAAAALPPAVGYAPLLEADAAVETRDASSSDETVGRSRGESLELYRPPVMDRKTSPLLETLEAPR